MGIPHYLAMTPEEFAAAGSRPEMLAWMSCQFSADGPGLTQLPPLLPAGSILVLDDSLPPSGHEFRQILREIQPYLQDIAGILLDFQRPGNPETAALAKALVQAQLCLTGVSEPYAKSLDCPVFLPPTPLHCPVEEYLSTHAGREIWLDTAPDRETILVTSEGIKYLTDAAEQPGQLHHDPSLHCHYRTTVTDSAIRFSLFRMPSDEADLINTAAGLGVTKTFGLFQDYQRV